MKSVMVEAGHSPFKIILTAQCNFIYSQLSNYLIDNMDNTRVIKRESFCFNPEKIDLAKKSLPEEDVLNDLSELFKCLGDPTRLRILYALSKKELCVCDISHVLGMSLPAISYQLRVLRNLKLVKFANKGKMTFYSLSDNTIISLLEQHK